MNHIAIIMLTHNAPRYVKESVNSIYNNTLLTENSRYTLNVLDNKSSWLTKKLLKKLKKSNKISALSFQEENLFFAKGNNIAFDKFAKDTQYILLLNSDIKVQASNWLQLLVDEMNNNSKLGAIAYGAVMEEPIRADGYAILIRSELYDKFRMEEKFQWWWGVTKLEAQILNDGFDVMAIRHHDEKLLHYGGKSGNAWKTSSGTGIDINEVNAWFDNKGVEIVEHIEDL
ncbi:glycosyltransferase [Leuconostoc mesenteroides subsp. mesenteroides]